MTLTPEEPSFPHYPRPSICQCVNVINRNEHRSIDLINLCFTGLATADSLKLWPGCRPFGVLMATQDIFNRLASFRGVWSMERWAFMREKLSRAEGSTLYSWMKSRRTRTRLPAASVSVVASGSRTRSRSGCASVSVFSFRSSHCAANRASERTRRGLLRRDPQVHRIEHEILSRSLARPRLNSNHGTPNQKRTAVTFDLNFNSIKKKCKVK